MLSFLLFWVPRHCVVTCDPFLLMVCSLFLLDVYSQHSFLVLVRVPITSLLQASSIILHPPTLLLIFSIAFIYSAKAKSSLVDRYAMFTYSNSKVSCIVVTTGIALRVYTLVKVRNPNFPGSPSSFSVSQNPVFQGSKLMEVTGGGDGQQLGWEP
jgi:hypothetical protein